ncbi:hypothetical protein [Spirosoma sp. KNUC1025]|uniref:hypothetical protein n=1 Tax=Spirosoma sp. KNUC1025 TaxID=2894082 RepID=UPI00386A21C9|nr:hypothetical protein LN737_08350 [Spirosoma sp. KNUC1025]
MESTNLLNNSCLPTCWPRDFSPNKRANQFIAYILDSTYSDQIKPKFSNKKHGGYNSTYMEFDSVFYPLLEQLNHVKREKISIQDVKFLSRPDIKIGLVKGLIGNLSDNALGYLQISPVIVNKSNDKGVFFYSLIGVNSKSWVVSVKKGSQKWQIVNQYILGTS